MPRSAPVATVKLTKVPQTTKFLSGATTESGISWPWIKWFQNVYIQLTQINTTVGIFSAGGDLGGTNTNQKVIGLDGIAFGPNVAAPTNGQAIVYNSVLNKYVAGIPGVTSNFADEIIPLGAIDGVNVTYVFPQPPNPQKSLQWYRNGVLMAVNVDYSLIGAIGNLFTPLAIGDKHVAWYRF